jgi:hypothetical protein
MKSARDDIRPPARSTRLGTVSLADVALGAVIVASLLTLAVALAWSARDPVSPGPPQPIRFSHRQHTQALELGCTYCHVGADSESAAGMPSAQICMSCHRFVLASAAAVRDEQWHAARAGRRVQRVVSAELRKLYTAQGLDDGLRVDPSIVPRPIAWTAVTRVPDHVRMPHGLHARAGVGCGQCHGPVETFERTHVARPLTMGACVDCHRRGSWPGRTGSPGPATIDCVACHR